ncbi:alpha/beta fold hydrolase [Tumebacillus lipolyticus]|uniref:Alpha/beta fold hydrolase n=1 Tax=Tumebacillus lipolyticus TaxID=1280370 RepID=A0ABW4ZXQ0_9BACL
MGYYVRVEPNVNIYVEDVDPGGGKPILFLHGWPANHKLFEYQFNVLPAKGFRCIGWDMRGFGKSDRPWTGYHYDRLADDVRGVVEALGLQDFTLAGHSVGGAIATRYMGRHHGYGVSKLALIAAAAPSVTQRPVFPHGLPAEEVSKLIRATYADRPQMLQDFTNLFFFQNLTQPFADWFFQLGVEAAGHATAKVATSFRDESTFADLGKINVPTLIMHGIHDKICLPQLALALHRAIRNSKLLWFQYSGHGLFWEERNKFNEELEKFIN